MTSSRNFAAAGTIRRRSTTPAHGNHRPSHRGAGAYHQGLRAREAGEGRNITHQQKKLNEDEIVRFRSRFEIPIPESSSCGRTASFYTARPTIVPRLRLLCMSGAAFWAATCRSAWCRRADAESASRRRSNRPIQAESLAGSGRAVKFRAPWRSCACSHCCSRTRRWASM